MTQPWKPVKLAAKVIGHISQGMYRTPSGAIKELISNAYDADATYAKIHTGFPNFSTFSCEDDGHGISKDKFIELMEGGIGESDKRTPNTTQLGKNGRPIVGRLGVGLVAIAQICSRFSVRSFHQASKTAFEAEIKFPPYSRQDIDRAIKDETKLVHHGEYRIVDISYEKGAHGIIVTTTALRDMFRKTMSNLEVYANQRSNNSSASYATFDQFLESTVNPELSSLYFSSQYDQLLFGLALASPIPYVERKSKNNQLETIHTKIPQLSKLQEELKKFDFRVEIDNMELRRPVVLPSNKSGTKVSDCKFSKRPEREKFTLRDGVHEEEIHVDKYNIDIVGGDERFQLFCFNYIRKVNGYPLKFSGYIFLQTTRLFPKEYQGILIRLRNVAIGQYDVNVMTYPQAEGPRFSMLSAEVFVAEGLDDALKVDRDGFNTLDPQYIRLQAFVHSILHALIFPGSWEEEKTRNRLRRVEKERQEVSTFKRKLQETTKKQYAKVMIVSKEKGKTPARAVVLEPGTGTIKIYESHPDARAVMGKRKHHGVAARVLAAFEIANRATSGEERRRIFYKLIEDIFNE